MAVQEVDVQQDAEAKPVEMPRISRARILMVAIVAGFVSGVIGTLAKRWTHDSILPAVLGGTLAGVIAVIFERRANRSKPRR